LISDKSKKSLSIKGVLNFVLSIILTIIFLYIAFKGVDFSEVLSVVSNASIFWIIVFVIAQFIAHYLRAVRWKIILKSVKPEASVKYLFGAIMVGYGINCVIPRLGEISRAILVGKWERLSRSSMLGTVILERVIDIIFLGIAVTISLVIWSSDLNVNFPWLESTLYISMIAVAGAALFLYLAIRFRERFYGIIVKFVGKLSEKIAYKVAHMFNMLTEGFGSLKGTKNYLLTFALSASIMLMYGLSSYLGFFILNMQDINHVNFGMGWVVMSISAIGVVIPTPGGTGSYHALAKSTLVLLFGFGQTVSLAYAFITHLITYSLIIFTALIVFFILNKKHESFLKLVKADPDET
jgi:uncharacterized protein (TIRG00374 family)